MSRLTQSDLQVKRNTLIGSISKRPAHHIIIPTSLHWFLVPTSDDVRAPEVDLLEAIFLNN
jgi:hypothetical protein